MVNMSHSEVIAHESKLKQSKGQVESDIVKLLGENLRESVQHDQIMAWCDTQWPRWKYVHARTDKPSTLPVGCSDFVIFGPYPICFLVECKTMDGKIGKDQRIWIKEMEMLGWIVNITRSFDEFMARVITEKARVERA